MKNDDKREEIEWMTCRRKCKRRRIRKKGKNYEKEEAGKI